MTIESIEDLVNEKAETIDPDAPTETETEVTEPEELSSQDLVLSRILDAITPLGEVSDKLKALFYGPFGSGKTVLGCSIVEILPPDKKLLFIDLEEGWTTIKRNWPQWVPRIERMEFRSTNQLLALGDFIKMNHPAFEHIGAVLIDTVSEYASKDMDALMIREAAKVKGRDAFDPENLWNINSQHIRRVLGYFRDSTRHFIMTAHEREREIAKGTKVYRTTANMTPTVLSTCMQMCDVVGYLEADGKGKDRTRTLIISGDKKLDAKSRLWAGLPEELKHPTIKDLLRTD